MSGSRKIAAQGEAKWSLAGGIIYLILAFLARVLPPALVLAAPILLLLIL